VDVQYLTSFASKQNQTNFFFHFATMSLPKPASSASSCFSPEVLTISAITAAATIPLPFQEHNRRSDAASSGQPTLS
jgi:hypothetical protein